MSQHSIAWPTVATAAVLAVGATYFLMISTAIHPHARLYPQVFLLATLGGSLVLGIGELLQGFRARPRLSAKEGAGAAASSAAALEMVERSDDPDRGGWPLYAALVLYALVMERLGFLLSTMLFLAGVLTWLRLPPKHGIPLGVAGVLVIFVIFRTAMYVSLPAGPLDIYLLELMYGG